METLQQQPPDKVRKLYDFLKKNNVRVHNTYEEFKVAMQDERRLSQAYDYLKKNHPDSVESADFNSFQTNLGLKKKDSTTPSSIPSQPAGQTLESGLTEEQEKQRNLQELSQQPVSTYPSAPSPEETVKPETGFLGTLKAIWNDLTSAAKTPATPEDKVPSPFLNAIERGTNQAEQAGIINPFQGTDIKPEQLERVAELQTKNQQLPTSKAYKEFNEAKSVGGSLSALAKNPASIIAELTGESMSALVQYGASRIGAGAALGAGLGSVVPGIGTASGAGGGALVGMADSSLGLEYSGKFIESLQEQGIDVSNADALKKAFENDEIISKARSSALKKGIPIAIFDLISGGIAGKIVTKPAKSLVGKIGQSAAEFGVQAAMGGAGELSGQLASGEQINPSAIIAEMVGELGTTPIEVSNALLTFNKKVQNQTNDKSGTTTSVQPKAAAETPKAVAANATAEIGGEVQPGTKSEVQSKVTPKENAIQKRSTEKISMDEASGDSQKMEQGISEQKEITAPQGKSRIIKEIGNAHDTNVVSISQDPDIKTINKSKNVQTTKPVGKEKSKTEKQKTKNDNRNTPSPKVRPKGITGVISTTGNTDVSKSGTSNISSNSDKAKEEAVSKQPVSEVTPKKSTPSTEGEISETKSKSNGKEQTQGRQERLLKSKQEKTAEAHASADLPVVEEKITPEKQQEESKKSSVAVGDEVEFEWLGEKIRGEVYEITKDRVKVKKGGINYPMKPERVYKPKVNQLPESRKMVSSTAQKISEDLDNISGKAKEAMTAPKGKDQANVTFNPLKIIKSAFGGLNKAQEATFGKFSKGIENYMAKKAKQGLSHTNYAVRNTVGVLQNLMGGLSYTQGDLKNKLDYTGNKNYGHLKAHLLAKDMYSVIGSDPDALMNVHAALDPEVYLGFSQQGTTLLDERSALEKDIRSKHREIAKANESGEPIQAIDALENELADMADDLDAKNKEITEYTKTLQKDAKSKLNAKENYLYDIIRKTNDYIHEWYHDQGLLDDDTYAQNKGSYIARMYEDFELQDPEITNQIKSSRADFSMLKNRKEFEDVKATLLRDPVFATAKRVAQMMQTQAIFEYADAISKNKDIQVSDTPFPKSIRLGPEAKSKPFYGVLTNKFVPDFIAQDFKGFYFGNEALQSIFEGFRGYDKSVARQFLKKLHTIYNPLVQLGNKLSNYSFAFWAGIDPYTFTVNKFKAKDQIKNNGQYYQELVKSGVVGSDLLTTDLTPAQRLRDQQNALSQAGATVYNKIIDVLNKASDKASEYYGKTDDISKLSAYISLVEDYGYSKEQAQIITYEAFQNYATVGKLYDFASKTPVIGNPYVKFKADLARIIKNAVTRRPLTTAFYLGILVFMKELLSDLSDEDEDVKKVRERRPFIPKIKTPFGDIPMTWQTPAGEINFARFLTPYFVYDKGDRGSMLSDITSWLPYQFEPLPSTTSKENEVPIPEFNDVLLGVWADAVFDRDYRGKSVRDPQGSKFSSIETDAVSQTLNALEYIARSQVPMFASSQDMYAAYNGDADYYGRERTITQALLNSVIKVQEFGSKEAQKSLETEIRYKVSKFESLSRDISSIKFALKTKVREIQESSASDTRKQERVKEELDKFQKRVRDKIMQQKQIVKELETPVELLKTLK